MNLLDRAVGSNPRGPKAYPIWSQAQSTALPRLRTDYFGKQEKLNGQINSRRLPPLRTSQRSIERLVIFIADRTPSAIGTFPIALFQAGA